MGVGYVALLVHNDFAVNGLGESVKSSDTILQWDADLKIFEYHLASGVFPEGYSIFIPDFWHICYGDAKCLPKVEADELWESTVKVREACEPYLKHGEVVSEMVLKPHPGTRLYLNKTVRV